MEQSSGRNHAAGLQAQITASVEQAGAKISPAAFSNHDSADVTITIPVALTLTHRIKSSKIAGHHPIGHRAASAQEANAYLDGLAREKIQANIFTNAVNSRASTVTAKLLGSGTFTLSSLQEQATTLQTCNSCSNGKIACNQCQGSTKLTCNACRGRKKIDVPCSTCGGTGLSKCPHCYGNGKKTNVYQVRSADGTAINAEMRYEDCTWCEGRGTLFRPPCPTCWGSKTVSENCRPCGGRGSVACSKCSASGSIACDTCQGQFQTTTVFEAELYVVSSTGSLVASDRDRAAFIERNLSLLAADPRFTPRLTKFKGAKGSFTAELEGSVPVSSIRVTAAGKTFDLHAIGPSLVWTSRPKIVDALLVNQLSTLKKTRSANLGDIGKLVGTYQLALAVLDGAKAGNSRFSGTLLPGMSHSMADEFQTEATRLWKSGLRRRLGRRLAIGTGIAAPLIAGSFYAAPSLLEQRTRSEPAEAVLSTTPKAGAGTRGVSASPAQSQPSANVPGKSVLAKDVPAKPQPTQQKPAVRTSQSPPKALTGVWRGRYYCGQGETALNLTVSSGPGNRVEATFAFRAGEGERGPRGDFRMSGQFDQTTHRLQLQPTRWINQPLGFEFLPIDAEVDLQQGTLNGTIDFPDCSWIRLRKQAD